MYYLRVKKYRLFFATTIKVVLKNNTGNEPPALCSSVSTKVWVTPDN